MTFSMTLTLIFGYKPNAAYDLHLRIDKGKLDNDNL